MFERLFKIAASLLVVVLLSGCAYDMVSERDRLQVTGGYGELARLSEADSAKKPTTTRLHAQCLAYSKLKRYDKLLDCADRLEANIRSGDTRLDSREDNPNLAAAFAISSLIVGKDALLPDVSASPHIFRAEAYLELGDYQRVVDEARRGLKLGSSGTSPQHVLYQAISLGHLSVAYALLGESSKAANELATLEQLSIPYTGSAYNEPEKMNALGRGYMALKKYDKALPFLEKDFSAFRSLADMVTGASARGKSMFTAIEMPRQFLLNRCRLELGKLANAREGFDTLLNQPTIADSGDIYWLSLFDRGRIAEQDVQRDKAIGFYRRAIETIELQRATINSEASKIGFVGDKQAVYGRLIAVLIEQGRANEAFDYVERSKSRALVDMLASKKDFAAQDSAQAALVLAQLDAADLNARVQDESAKPEAKTTGARNLQVAREALQSAAPELSTLVTVTSVPSAELKALVGADETLIEYYYQGTDLYAFILDRERLLAVKLDATELASQVQTLRKTLEATESPAWQEPARAIYARLWQPLEKLVTSKNLIVVAHGALHYLPFAALQDASGQFLLDRYSLRFLPSASVLKFLRPVLQNKDARLLALGNPDLDDPKLDLAFAEGEAKLVASLYPSSRVLVRKDASETNFKKAGGVFSRIHFASHGKFQADEPLKSGLYLAKDADNDGVLTVGELYSMNLEADLVTLSACETGLGKIASGDDVVGLTRGFLYAGSRSIVASLWSVDDKATATLMQAFYANLASMNKREALRHAQVKARETFPHPFFWAAFQLTGRAE
ncbi:MAG: CHAT domain-containing protein [Sulfuritalea sp.]|nr:CHAT domain-containing protein [Sulfuritalea sp.]